MSINIPDHFVSQFASNIELLLQQRGSKLRGAVMSGSHYGKEASPVDQIGAVEMQSVTSRFQPMGRVDAALDRRWVYPSSFDLPQLIDHFDKLKLLLDPESAYVQNAVFAAGRKMDDLIIDAFFGDAKTGETGGTTTSFPAGQQVGVQFGASANTNLTVKKLKEAKRILMANEVDVDADPLFCVVTASQHDSLLDEAQIISTDYNDKPVLVDGKIMRFLGINFIHCERLDTDSNSYRQVPVFAKSGHYLGIWEDITTDISQRKDIQSLPFQAYVHMTAGSTRLEEEKVVEVKCAES